MLRGRRRERKVCKKNKAFLVPLIQGLSPADSRRVRSPVEAVYPGPSSLLPQLQGLGDWKQSKVAEKSESFSFPFTSTLQQPTLERKFHLPTFCQTGISKSLKEVPGH